MPEAEVAAKLNRAERDVEHRRLRLGIPSTRKRAPRRNWTAQELSLFGKIGDKKFARRFSRSVSAVRAKRRDLGVAVERKESRAWTKSEEKLLLNGSNGEMAERIGRSALAVDIHRESWASLTQR
jgi:hypothetical protein